jgi:hypothetical protein
MKARRYASLPWTGPNMVIGSAAAGEAIGVASCARAGAPTANPSESVPTSATAPRRDIDLSIIGFLLVEQRSGFAVDNRVNRPPAVATLGNRMRLPSLDDSAGVRKGGQGHRRGRRRALLRAGATTLVRYALAALAGGIDTLNVRREALTP